MANNKILIPLTQSELSQEIFPSVEKFFSPSENDLILYFVTKPPSAAGFGEPDLSAGYAVSSSTRLVHPTLHPIYETQQQDNIRAHVESELGPVITRLKTAGYQVSLEVGFDKDPVSAIKREIKHRKINLLAMSSRARVGVTRFFFRNIADTITQHAKIPVLLVHPSDN
ncbi:MAG: nucleotide-binding universal stress UspA family protein [Gammaproteobacteria bacterium]|jgi:nucleotide-binding universal stress UspA family protein